MRRGRFTPSSRTPALFCFFAQCFTDSFLRTASGDRRRNTSNHEIDLRQVYGLDEQTSDVLRKRRGGRLRTQNPLPTGVFPTRLFDDDGALRPEFSTLGYARGAPGQRVVDGLLPMAFGEPFRRRSWSGASAGSTPRGWSAAATPSFARR